LQRRAVDPHRVFATKADGGRPRGVEIALRFFEARLAHEPHDASDRRDELLDRPFEVVPALHVDSRRYAFFFAKSCMKSVSVFTHSTGTALYIDTRIPPTVLCPLMPIMPCFFASATKRSSSASFGKRKTAFITERLPFSTGHR